MAEKEKTKTKGKWRLAVRFLRGTKLLYAVCAVSAVLSSLAATVQPQIVRTAVDNVIGASEETDAVTAAVVARVGGLGYLRENVWVLAVAVVAVALVNVGATYLFRVSETKASGTLMKNMRDELFAHIERLPFSWFAQNRTGDVIQRATTDIDTVKNFISEQLSSLVRVVLNLALAAVFMFRMNVSLAWIALIPMPVFLVISLVFHNKMADSFEKCDEDEGLLSAVAQENLSGVRVVRAFGREKAEIGKFEKQNAEFTDGMKYLDRQISRFWCSTDVLAGLQILSILVFGALFCIRGSVSTGEFIAFLSYNAMLVWPVRELGETISNLARAGVSLERIAEVMASPVEKDRENAVPMPVGDIVFDKVSFGYDGAEVLHDVSFTLPRGRTLGILGGTGSGKTTLMLLLDKLYTLGDGEGRITIGGVDLRDIRTAELRRSIGMVLQEPYLFSDTLGANIKMVRPNASADALCAVTEAAALRDTVASFADGYETTVGEGGVTLSGGQKQRVAIARLLLAEPPIMIFDDSLSAVDTETDAKIRRAIAQRFGHATVILISHRIATLRAADNIIVLERGRIVEEGSHEALKTAGGLYQKIYEAQNGKEDCHG